MRKSALPAADDGATRAATAAERQRAHRDRKRRGLRVAHLEIDDVAAAESLIAFGLLAPCDADDPVKADAALSKAVAAWTKA